MSEDILTFPAAPCPACGAILAARSYLTLPKTLESPSFREGDWIFACSGCFTPLLAREGKLYLLNYPQLMCLKRIWPAEYESAREYLRAKCTEYFHSVGQFG